MKSVKLVVAFLLIFSFSGYSQTLTGLWNGTFSNDSTTLRSDQPFEIALTEYRGKVYGYSRREFLKNDTLYFVLKRVKGKIEGDSCEVTEDEFLSHNLPTIDKGVKITYTFRLNKRDTTWSLDGKWKTNKVNKRKNGFYALTGQVGMITEKDLSKSKLFPHLTELKLDEDVPFYATYKKKVELENEQKNIAFNKTLAESRKVNTTVIADKKPPANDVAQSKPIAKKEEQPIAKTNAGTKPVTDVTKTTNNKNNENNAANNIATSNTPKVETVKTSTEISKKQDESKPNNEAVAQQKDLNKTATEKDAGKEKQAVQGETIKQTDVAISKPKETAPVAAKPVAAADIEKRRSETIQSIEFKSDSITLSLFDNGEIDGDTVSVLINGEIVLPQQGLKATAIRKTIYVTEAMKDSFNLVLYAENLGKYAPNTGLIIVRDGEDTHLVRFSADFQKNVEVIFRRKKK